MSRPSRPRPGQFSDVALVITLLVLISQLYLFETVLQSVLDGHRALLPGAFAASSVLTAVALLLTFKARGIDGGPQA
jgi:hypothetical protein